MVKLGYSLAKVAGKVSINLSKVGIGQGGSLPGYVLIKLGGEEALSKLAKEQEMAVKEGRIEQVLQEYSGLLSAYGNLIKEIEGVLKKKQYGPFDEKRAAGLKPIEEETMAEQIRKALFELERFRSKEAAKIIQELLECAVPENVKEELEQIQILLKMYEDDKAEDALRELIQKL